MEWISVKHRLPDQEKGNRFLVYQVREEPHTHHDSFFSFPYICCQVAMGYYVPDPEVECKWRSELLIPITPTHWMPLPEPPENSP